MQSSFTPGPWSVEPIDYGCFDVKCEFGYFIATCHDGVRGTRNADVNARLIAGAPEMLAALKAYEAWADKTICKDVELSGIRKQIRAAIARATGEQP